jgi:uncharacterized protein (DUF697 family)
MGVEDKLLKVAVKLAVKAANRGIDEVMPEKLAGIVKIHAVLGVGAAWVPVPGASFAAAVASIWSMYYRINKMLNMPFRENVIKSVASGVGTNLARYLGIITVAEGLKFIPGIGSLASALILSTAQYALLLASGYVYMKSLTLLLDKKSVENVTESDFNDAVAQVMSDQESIKSFINEAKKSYKNKKGD